MRNLQCAVCGSKFISGKARQRYCSAECRKIARKRNEGKSSYRRYKTKEAVKQPAEYQWNNPLARAAVAAAEQGMTYGQVQAQRLAATVKIERGGVNSGR